MNALLEPTGVTFYAPIPDSGVQHCKAWGLVLRCDAPDGNMAWKDGCLSLIARCEQKAHDGLRWPARYMGAADRDGWHRVTRRIKREDE